MKKLVILAALAIGSISMMSSPAEAQVNISVNIGSQPDWGPRGYNYVEYYYLPEIESYYNVRERQFIYLNNERWVFSESLPSRYRNYDLYRGYKVVVNQPRPYLHYKEHKFKYKKYEGYHDEHYNNREDHDDDRYENNSDKRYRNADYEKGKHHGKSKHDDDK
nr:hypothetical protein [Pseudopedobacter sp.]